MLRLGLVADVHMHDGDHAAIERALEGAVSRIEAFDPHRTVVLGDLIEDESRAADVRNLERVQAALAPLEPRFLAGNHDGATLDRAELTDRFGHDLAGHETVDGVELVYLDTAAPDAPRWRVEVGPEGRRLLDRALEGAAAGLVFAHHPVHYHDLARNPWFGEHPELAFAADTAWVGRILEDRAGALATFNGHLHEHHHAVGAGAHHFTINAVSKERPDSGEPRGTHALVTLDERLRVEVYDRDGFVREWAVPR